MQLTINQRLSRMATAIQDFIDDIEARMQGLTKSQQLDILIQSEPRLVKLAAEIASIKKQKKQEAMKANA